MSDTRIIANKNLLNTVNLIEPLENENFSNFVKKPSKIINKKFDSMQRNKLPIFGQPATKITSNNQVTKLKKNAEFFSQFYVVCEFKDGNHDQFFTHESQSFFALRNQTRSPNMLGGYILLFFGETCCLLCYSSWTRNYFCKFFNIQRLYIKSLLSFHLLSIGIVQ